jgi:predicted nuclease of predicted toxin-antitoxin system
VKLLFDQNISSRIVPLLQSGFPDCTQVTLQGLQDATDSAIWHWARTNSYCVVTFDSDFLDLLTLRGFPPKILLLRTGNRRTRDLAIILEQRQDLIHSFLSDPEIGCLEILLEGFR